MEKQFEDDSKEGRLRGVNEGQDLSSNPTVEATHAPIYPRFDAEQQSHVTREQTATEVSTPSLSMYRLDPSTFQPGPGPGTVPLSVMDQAMGPSTSGSMTTDNMHPTSGSTGASGTSIHISSATMGSSSASYAPLPFAAFAPNQTDVAGDTAGSPAIDTTVAIVQPREYDILYGRGKTRRKHPGNKRMKLLIDLHRDAYTKANRITKTNMSKDIVKIIKCSGDKSGRFLRFETKVNGWVEVSDAVAREKVSHALRDGKTKPLERIDPKVLDEIPMLSDQIKQHALHRLATLTPKGESFQSALTSEEQEQYAQSEIPDHSLHWPDDSKAEEMDQKPAAEDQGHEGVPPDF